MQKTLTFAVCKFLVPELVQVIKQGDYPDVNLVSFPASCSAGAVNFTFFNKLIDEAKSKNSDLIILSSSCNPFPVSQKFDSNVKLIILKQCFEILLNSETVFHFIAKRYYIASNGWLRLLEQHKKKLGFRK